MNINARESLSIPNEEPFGTGSQTSPAQNEFTDKRPLLGTMPEELPLHDSESGSIVCPIANDELFRLLVETVKDYAIFMLDSKGHVVSWNAGAVRIKGYQADEVLGHHFSIFYPTEDCNLNKPQSSLLIAAREGRTEDEGWRLRKDGTRFWAHVVITALRDAAGNLKGFSKITRDLTERRQANDDLQKSKNQVRELVSEMEAVLDNMPIPIFFAHDSQGLHVKGNRAGEELLRIGRGSDASMGPPDVARPAHFKPFHAGRELNSSHLPTQRAIQGATVRDFDFELVFNDGTIRKMLGYAVPLWGDAGRPRGAVTVLVDVTERMKTEMALKLTEQRLRFVLEASKIGSFEFELTSGKAKWNSVIFQLLGLEPGDVPEDPESFFRFVHPEDAEQLRHKWELAKHTGEFDVEFRIIRADGCERWLAGKGSFIFEGGGQEEHHEVAERPVRFLGVNYDITERKQAELALVESERQFRAFFENAGVGLAQIDAIGQFIRVNNAFCAISGYCREQLLAGMRPLDLDHPDDRDFDHSRNAKFMSGETPVYDVEKRYLRPDGKSIWVHVTATASRNAAGTLRYSAAVITDITERQRVERDLREKTERLRSILNTAADAIVVFDMNGNIDMVNPNAERMFGYASNEMVGLNINRLMPKPFQERYVRFLRQYRQVGSPTNISIRREGIGIRKDGKLIPIDLNLSGIDHLGFFTAVLRDNTERQRLEQHVLEIAAEEQRRIAQELHDSTQQELAGMSMLAEVIVNLLDQGKQVIVENKNCVILDHQVQKQLLVVSNKLCQRLSESSRNVRNLSHGIMPVQIDVDGLRSSLAQLAMSIDGVNGISCQFECRGNVIVENATAATNLYRIAQEALNNAIRHGRSTEIRILLGTIDDRLVLEIGDNGVGFDPLYMSADSVTSQTHGMGLRIMQYRARLIGGSLLIQRRDEGGICVRCEVLPAAVMKSLIKIPQPKSFPADDSYEI